VGSPTSHPIDTPRIPPAGCAVALRGAQSPSRVRSRRPGCAVVGSAHLMIATKPTFAVIEARWRPSRSDHRRHEPLRDRLRTPAIHFARGQRGAESPSGVRSGLPGEAASRGGHTRPSGCAAPRKPRWVLIRGGLVSCAGNPLHISADPGVRRQGAGPRLVPGVLGRTSNAADVRLGRRDTWRISGAGH
jgi:hypothetical protein